MINPLKVGAAADALGRALVPAPTVQEARPRPTTPYLQSVAAFDRLFRTKEEAEAFAWRATHARREARSLGRIVGALATVAVAAWLDGRRKG